MWRVVLPIMLWLVIFIIGNIFMLDDDSKELWFRLCGFLFIFAFLPFIVLGINRKMWKITPLFMWFALCIFGFICVQKYNDNYRNWVIGCGLLIVAAGYLFGKSEREQRIEDSVEAMRRFEAEKQAKDNKDKSPPPPPHTRHS